MTVGQALEHCAGGRVAGYERQSCGWVCLWRGQSKTIVWKDETVWVEFNWRKKRFGHDWLDSEDLKEPIPMDCFDIAMDVGGTMELKIRPTHDSKIVFEPPPPD